MRDFVGRQMLANTRGELAPDPGQRRQLFEIRLANPFQASEVREQRAPLGRADAGNVVERGVEPALRAQIAVEGDRETMRLVANVLQQV